MATLPALLSNGSVKKSVQTAPLRLRHLHYTMPNPLPGWAIQTTPYCSPAGIRSVQRTGIPPVRPLPTSCSLASHPFLSPRLQQPPMAPREASIVTALGLKGTQEYRSEPNIPSGSENTTATCPQPAMSLETRATPPLTLQQRRWAGRIPGPLVIEDYTLSRTMAVILEKRSG